MVAAPQEDFEPRELCILSLGSNRGDRLENIKSALKSLARLPGTRLGRVSSIYETTPVGVRGQRNYFNRCAEIRTGLSPLGLLVELKRLEAALGRKPGPHWGPRPLDIDILFYGRRKIRSRLLTIPHPRALKRRFVLAPLAELRPDWSPPVFPRRHVSCWLSRLRPRGTSVRLGAG